MGPGGYSLASLYLINIHVQISTVVKAAKRFVTLSDKPKTSFCPATEYKHSCIQRVGNLGAETFLLLNFYIMASKIFLTGTCSPQ